MAVQLMQLTRVSRAAAFSCMAKVLRVTRFFPTPRSSSTVECLIMMGDVKVQLACMYVDPRLPLVQRNKHTHYSLPP